MNGSKFPTGCSFGAAACSIIATLCATPVGALDFKAGDLDVRLDTTVSIGGMYRLSDPDPALYGIPNSGPKGAGQQNSVNADDGNLNYHKGWASVPVVATADLELRYSNFGAFVRANAFYDFENADGTRERTPLSKDAMERVAYRFDMLDAYMWANFDVGVPVNLRIGRQVVNWGESTFITNGINAINPVDVGKIRLPGAELRDALLPVWSATMSLTLTDDLSIDLFYQFVWKEVVIDPPGSYFSTNDFAGRGGNRVYLGFGSTSIPDKGPLGFIPRGPNSEPKDSGQYGAALRYYAAGLSNTEFGLYFLNYHSRLPVISARTPTTPISPAVVQGTASNLAAANLAPAMIANGVPADTVTAVLPQLLGAALTNVPAASLPPTLAPFAPFYPAAQQIAAGARQVGLLTSAATGRYLVEYPEDIKLMGLSFNTDFGATGISLQGEVSYRWDQPLQVDDVELLYAALSAIFPGYGAVNQLGSFPGELDRYVAGYKNEEVWQAQVTATKVFGPMLGASQAVLLVEIGANYVPGLPDKNVLRFDGPGTFLGGNPLATAAGLQPGTEAEHAFADKFSWGYRVVTRLDFTNVFFNLNMSPSLQWAHDVEGNTPLPLGTFQHGRKSIAFALETTYQYNWGLTLNYTNYFGAGKYNLIADRDFVSATLKYSF
jgi:hypothetical protein